MTTTKPVNQEGGIRKILRNTSYLLGSQLTTWTMTIATMIIVPKYLGPAGIGEFGVAESVWLVASAFTLFGLDTHLTKTVAREPEKVSIYFGTALVNTLFNYILTFGGVLLFAYISGYSTLRMQLIAIAGFGSLAYSFINLAQAVLIGIERFDYVSKITVINRAVFTVLAISVLLLGGGLYEYAFATVAASIIGSFLMVGALFKADRFDFKYDFALSKQFFREGRPYFLALIFLRIYKEADTIIMAELINDATELGWYKIADQLFGTLMFLPNLLIATLFPILSRLHNDGDDSLSIYVSKSFNFLFLIGIPIGLGISAIARPVIDLIYGDAFSGSADILQYLGFVLIITYQTMLIGYFLISIDKQRLWTITMIVAAVATIPLDYVLVPFAATFGPAGVGGALAYMVTESGMVLAGLYFLPDDYLNSSNFIFFIKAMVAGLLMFAGVTYLTSFGLVPAIAAGVVIYPAAILLLRTIPNEDMVIIQSLAAPLTSRLQRFRHN